MGEGEGVVGEGRVGEGIGERKGGEAGERGDGVGGEGVRWRKKGDRYSRWRPYIFLSAKLRIDECLCLSRRTSKSDFKSLEEET